MKPAKFDYVRAETLTEALDVLHHHGSDARILAGGQSLIPMLNMRLARPAVLVDIMHIPGLDTINDTGQALHIGAACRQQTLLARPDLSRRQPLLAAALPWVGHTQTRSRGTICGSIAHADPSAEISLVLIALGGEIVLRNHRRRRRLPAELFFTGMMATARAEDEIIEAVSIPTARPGTGYAFREIARRHGDFAIVGCAAIIDQNTARLAVAGVADQPTARDFTLTDLEAALDAFAWDLDARDDLHATAAYRRELVRQVGRQTIEEAQKCRA